MSLSDSTLVFGATGTQGGAVLRRLRSLGSPVRAAVASSASKARLEADGIETVLAPLGDIDAVYAAFEGIEKAYLVLPVTAGSDSGTFVSNFLEAAKRQGTKFVVFEPRGSYPGEPTDIFLFESARALTQEVLSGPVPASVVRATVYLDNLLGPWSLPMIQGGLVGYPVPAEVRPGWTTADDTARVIAALLQQGSTAGEAFDVVSAGNPSGTEIAEAISVATGRSVRYQALSIDEFAQGLAATFGSPEVAEEIAKLYRFMASGQSTYYRQSDLSEFGVQPAESLLDWAKRQNWQPTI